MRERLLHKLKTYATLYCTLQYVQSAIRLYMSMSTNISFRVQMKSNEYNDGKQTAGENTDHLLRTRRK